MMVLRRGWLSGLLVGVLLAGILTATRAMGVMYSDAISINLVDGTSGTVSGPQRGGNGSLFGGWMNMSRVSGNDANYAASADNSGWTSWAFDSNLSATGAGLGSFRIQFYDGNWYANTSWNDPANGANTLGRSGISNGNMPNNWGPTGLSIAASAIPSDFVNAGYDIYALGGATRNSGSGLSWVKLNTGGLLHSATAPTYTFNSLGWRSVAAVQILKLAPPAPSMNVLGTNSLSIANNAPASVPDGTDFGVIIANSSAVTNTFIVTNAGALALYLTSTEAVSLTGDTSYFSVSTNGMTTNLAAETATSFTISFSSATLGTWTGVVTIANNDTSGNPYSFSVRGTVAPAIGILGINYASIMNGDVTPNEIDGTDFVAVNVTYGSRDRVFTVTNSGSDALYLADSSAVVITGTDSNEFTVLAPPSTTNIAAGASVPFTVRFDPTNTGLRQAGISIVNSDTNANPYSFSIQGTGTEVFEPSMTVKGINAANIANGSLASIAAGTDFGSVYTNAALSHVFGITNTGTGPLYLYGTPAVVIGGVDSNEFTVTGQPVPTNIVVWSETVFTVQFHPTNTGLRQATISIVNNDTNVNPYSFAIEGTGLEVPVMVVMGTNMVAITNGSLASLADGTDFGTQATNTALIHIFTITNSGTGLLGLNGSPAVTVGGTHSNDFTVTVQPAITNLAAAFNTTFFVRFNPAGLGLRTANISIANNDSRVNPYVFDIQGIGAVQDDIYSDAIGINLVNGASGIVSGPQTGEGGTLFGNWMNMTRVLLNHDGTANFAASADGSGWTSCAFDSNLSATGAGLGSFRIDFYDGGYGVNSSWNDPANGANTLGRSGFSNGDMPNGWGPAGSSINFNNIPPSFQTAGYDIFALGGATWESGAGLAWVKLNTSGLLYTNDPPGYALNSFGWRSVAAIQILKWDPLPHVANNFNPSDVRVTSAYLNGVLLRAGGSPAEVRVYWGQTDGGTNKTLWSTNFNFGYVPTGSYSHVISPAALNTHYYYRYYGTNEYGEAWSETTTNFMSQGGTTMLIR